MPLHVAENIRTSGSIYGSTYVSGNPLLAQNLTPSGVVYATTSGILQTDSSFLFDSNSNTVFVPNISITGLTPGSVLFVGSSGEVSQNNNHFYWDYNNSRLGIGIRPTPSAKLHVDTDAGENTTALYISNDDNLNNARSFHILTRSSGVDFTIENYAYDQSGVKVAYIFGSPTGTSFAPNGLYNADYQTFSASSGLNTVAKHRVGAINYGSNNFGGFVDFQSTTTNNTTLASHFVMSGGSNYSLHANPYANLTYDLGNTNLQWRGLYAQSGVFLTTILAGTSENAGGFRINSAGDIGPQDDAVYNLGSLSFTWLGVYAQTGSFQSFVGAPTGTFPTLISSIAGDKRVVFSSGGQLVTESGFVWDYVNKRLGINQSSPTATLHITPISGSTTGLYILGATSQTADLFSVSDSSANEWFSVGASDVVINQGVLDRDFAVYGSGSTSRTLIYADAGSHFVKIGGGATSPYMLTVQPSNVGSVPTNLFGVRDVSDNDLLTVYSTSTVVNDGGIDRDFRVEGSGNSSLIFVDASINRIGFGNPSPAAFIDINKNETKGSSTVGWLLTTRDNTFTNNSVASGGTQGFVSAVCFLAPTLAAANPDVITTNATTVYVQGTPLSGTNNNITNSYSIWVDDGTTRLDGHLQVGIGSGDLRVGTSSNAGSFLGNFAGHVGPQTDVTYDLGAVAHRWRNVYANSGIFTAGVSSPAFVDKQIAFASGNQLIGESGFIWDYSTKRLGVNQGAPQAGLHVTDGNIIVDSTSAATRYITLNNPSASNQAFWEISSTKVRFGVGISALPIHFRQPGLENLIYIGTTGLIGIGHASPVTKFHIFEDSVQTNNAGLTIEQSGTGDSTLNFLLTGGQQWAIGCDNSDSDKFKISDTINVGSNPIVTITTAELVGINNAAPTATLQVSNAAGATTTRTFRVDGIASQTFDLISAFDSSVNELFSVGASDFVVNEAGLDRDFRVESDNHNSALYVDGEFGTVGINVTVSSASGQILRTVGDYPLVVENSTNFFRNINHFATGMNIAAGVTDSGYRVGEWCDFYARGTGFAGTLDSQYGQCLLAGTFGTEASGTINTIYGLFLGINSGANCIHGVEWGLYQTATSNSSQNHFKGDIRVGTTGNPGSFKVNVLGNVGPNADNSYDLGSVSYRWRNIYGSSGIFSDGISSSSFVNKQIAFASGNRLIGESGFVWDYANNYLGINQGSPQQALHITDGNIIVEKTNTTNRNIAIQNSGGLSQAFWELQTDRIRFGAGGSALPIHFRLGTGLENVVYLSSAGLVGVNTSAPVSRLHVFQDTTSTSTGNGITIENSGTGDSMLQFLLTGGQRYVAGIDNSDSDKFKLAPGENLQTSPAITVNTSSQVGVGYDSPNYQLSLGTNLDNTKLAFYDSPGVTYGIGIQSSEFVFHVGSNGGKFSFYNTSSGTARMTIAGTGTVGINVSAPTATLHVTPALSSRTGIYAIGAVSQSADLLHVCDSSSNEWFSVGASDVVFNESSQDRDFRIESDGNVNMFVVDGGQNSVGIGYSNPFNEKETVLHVAGAVTSFRLPRTLPTITRIGMWRDNATQSIVPWGRLFNRNSDFIMSPTGYYGTAFPTGWGLYNNSGSRPELVASVIQYSGVPNCTNKVLKISYSGGAGGTTPGWGGFVISDGGAVTVGPTGSAINDFARYMRGNRFLQVLWAKIPTGRSLNLASNAIGTSGSSYWLTSTAGTDEWEKYVGMRVVGETGTLSSTTHMYLTGGSDTSFDWYVASCELIALDEGIPDQNHGLINVGHKENFFMDWGELLSTSHTYLATDTGNVTVGTSGNPGTFRINVRGDVGPNDDNVWKLGSLSYRWAAVHAETGSIPNLTNVSGINGIDISAYLTGSGFSLSGIAGNLTQAQVAFGATTANTVTGEAAFTWDTTNKRLAIASNAYSNAITTISGSNPQKLFLVGPVNDPTGYYMRFAEGTGTYLGAYLHLEAVNNKFTIGMHNADTTGLGDDSAAITILRSNRFVGITHHSPISPLHVFENSSNFDATAGLTIEQSGDGDAIAQFLLTGGQRWVIGLDNSDDDKFKISRTADLSNNPQLTITTDDRLGFGIASVPSGYFHFIPAGNSLDIMRVDDTSGNKLVTVESSETVFNQDALGRDLRVEGTTEPHLLYVNASINSVNIGTSNSSTGFILTVDGDIGPSLDDNYSLGDGSYRWKSINAVTGIFSSTIFVNTGSFNQLTLATVSDEQIPFSSGGYLQGHPEFVFDYNNSRFGLGTSSPAATVHIHDPNATDGSQLLRIEGERNWAFYQRGTGATSYLHLTDIDGSKQFSIDTTSYLVKRNDSTGSGIITFAQGGTNGRTVIGNTQTRLLATPGATVEIYGESGVKALQINVVKNDCDVSYNSSGTTDFWLMDASTDSVGWGGGVSSVFAYVFRRTANAPVGIMDVRESAGNSVFQVASTSTLINVALQDRDFGVYGSGSISRPLLYADAGLHAVGVGAGASATYQFLIQPPSVGTSPSDYFGIRDSSANEIFSVGASDIVINEAGFDRDFRIEGDTVTNLFFVDASVDSIGIAAQASEPYTLTVVPKSPAVTVNDTESYIGIRSSLQSSMTISSGVTDAGYRRGIYVDAYPNSSATVGTLAAMTAIHIDNGSFGTVASGTTSTNYGLRIVSYNQGTHTTTNLWGIYIQDIDGVSKNYIQRDLRVGTTSNAGSFLANFEGHVGPQTDVTHDLGSASYRWRNINAQSGTFTTLAITGLANTQIAFATGTAITGHNSFTWNNVSQKMAIASNSTTSGVVTISGTNPEKLVLTGPINDPTGIYMRMIETAGTYQGAYIHYDSTNNILNIGTHNLADSSYGGDSANISIVRANNRVGINYTLPISNFHIFENTTAVDTTAGVTIEQSGTGDSVVQFYLTGGQRWVAGIDNSDSDKFKISDTTNVGSNPIVTITTSELVGINNSSPTSALQVANAAGATTVRTFRVDGIASQTADLVGIYDSSVNELFSIGASDLIINEAGLARNFRIESAGNSSSLSVGSGGTVGININTSVNGNIFRTVSNYPDTLTSGTNFYRNQDHYSTGVVISPGMVDLGYRVAAWYSSYASNSGFQGTLANQYGIVVQGGTFDGSQTPSGTITNVYGYYVSLTKGVNCTHTNEWGFYHTGRGNNYFAGQIRTGTTANAGSFQINSAGHVGPQSNLTYDLGSLDYKWRNIYGGSGIFQNVTISGSGLSMIVSYPGDVLNTQVVFASGDNQFAGNNNFVWDHGTDRVGIHRSSPSGSLHVSSQLNSSPWVSPLVRFQRAGGGGWIDFACDASANWITTNDAGTNNKSLNFYVGCSGSDFNLAQTFGFAVSGNTSSATTREVMRIRGSGLIGINTTAPTGSLTIFNHTGNPGVTTLAVKAINSQVGPLVNVTNISNESIFHVSTSGVVLNDGGVAYDFRVESLDNPTMLNVLGSNNTVTIGTTTNPGSFMVAVSGDVGPESSGTRSLGSAAYPWNNIWTKNINGSPASGGGSSASSVTSGCIAFGDGVTLRTDNNLVWNSGNQRLGVNVTSPSHTVAIRPASTTTIGLHIAGNISQAFDLLHVTDASSNELFSVGVVDCIINDGGSDRDFRIETDGLPFMFYIDGGLNYAAFGSASNPGAFLVSSAGDIGPEASGTRSLGSAAYPWSDVYVKQGGTLNMANIGSLSGDPANLEVTMNIGSSVSVSPRFVFTTNSINPWNDNSKDLGSSSLKWRTLYCYGLEGVTEINGVPIATYLVGSGGGAGASGVISSGAVLFGTNAGTISGETAFTWDAANNRLGINVGSTPFHTFAMKPSTTSTIGMHVSALTSQTADLFIATDVSSNEFFSIGMSDLTINEAGLDRDFRVEGDTDTSLIFADAGLDEVGIGAPPNGSFKFTVNGNIGPWTSGVRDLGASSLTFRNLYLSSTGVLNIGTGLLSYANSTNQFQSSAGIIVTGTMLVSDSSSGSPGLGWRSDTNTGFWRIGSDDMGYSAGGVGRFRFDTSKISPLQTVSYDLGATNAYWRKIYVDDVVCNTINGGSPGGGGGIGGTIAANQIAYGASADTIAGSNNLWWNNGTVRMGVGTNSPDSTLHIDGGASSTYLTIEKDDATECGLRFDSTGVVKSSIILDNVENFVIETDQPNQDIKFKIHTQNYDAGGASTELTSPDRTALYIDASGWGQSSYGITGVNACVVLPMTGDGVTTTGASCDLVIEDINRGIVMRDVTLGTYYRIRISAGALLVEAV